MPSRRREPTPSIPAPGEDEPWGKPTELVPVKPLQQRYLELVALEGLTANEVAVRLGWTYRTRGQVKGEDRRVLRALGLEPWHSKGRDGKTYRQPVRRITYRNAVRLCRALGIDPVDIGV